LEDAKVVKEVANVDAAVVEALVVVRDYIQHQSHLPPKKREEENAEEVAKVVVNYNKYNIKQNLILYI
jgi:hypothetical protein